jgi:hypothetical protein
MVELPPRSPVETLDIPTEFPPTAADVAGRFVEEVPAHSVDTDQAAEREDDENHQLIGDVVVENNDDTDGGDTDEPPHEDARDEDDSPEEVSEPHPDEPDSTGNGNDGNDDEPPRGGDFDASDHDDEEEPDERTEPEEVSEAHTPEADDKTDEGAKILAGRWPTEDTTDTPESPYEEWMFEIPIKGIDKDDRDPDPNREHNVLEGRWPELGPSDVVEPDDGDALPPFTLEQPQEDTNATDGELLPEDHSDDPDDDVLPDEEREPNIDEPDAAGGGNSGDDQPPRDEFNTSDSDDENADDGNDEDDELERNDDTDDAGRESDQEDADESEADQSMSREEVAAALAAVIERARTSGDKLSLRRLLDELEEADIETVPSTDIVPYVSEVTDEPDEVDNGPDEQDETVDGELIDDEPEEELSPAELERQEAWSALEYRGLLHSRSETEYPPDSIAARKLKLDAITFEKQRLDMDSMMHPENKRSNDARLEQLTEDMAKEGAASRAKRTFASMLADERYMRFTPEQLSHLRDLAVEELSALDPRAAGSSNRWDELLVNLDSIDRTLDKWGDVMTSENPMKRALQLGRRALENSVARSAARRDSRTEDLLSEAEATLRGVPARSRSESGAIMGDIRRRVAGRRAGRGALRGAAVRSYLPGMTDRIVAGSLRRRARNDKLEAELQKIEQARREQVPGRRQAAKDAIKAADEEMAKAPTGQIRRKGNAAKIDMRKVREFGKSPRKTSSRPLGSRPPLGSPQRRQERREHKAAVRDLHAAQLRVRHARAQLNQHKAADRAVANIPMIGTMLAPKTVVAQVALQEAIMARDAAARSPHLRLPASVGRYVG